MAAAARFWLKKATAETQRSRENAELLLVLQARKGPIRERRGQPQAEDAHVGGPQITQMAQIERERERRAGGGRGNWELGIENYE